MAEVESQVGSSDGVVARLIKLNERNRDFAPIDTCSKLLPQCALHVMDSWREGGCTNQAITVFV